MSGVTGVGDRRKRDCGKNAGKWGIGDARGGTMGIMLGGGRGGFSSCDESPPIWGTGDCGTLNLPFRSLEPLDRDRDLDRRFLKTAVGDMERSSSSVSASRSTSVVFCSKTGR